MSLDLKQALASYQNIVEEFKDKAGNIHDIEELSKLKNSTLLKVKEGFRVIGKLEPEVRKEFGQRLNALIQKVDEVFRIRLKKLEAQYYKRLDEEAALDLSADWYSGGIIQPESIKHAGYLHPITEEVYRMIRIFQSMGFEVYQGRQLDDEVHPFDLLNIPPGHPAREAWDTFYTDEGFVPTPHTSNMQVRVLKDQMQRRGFARAVVFGKVFRNEELDARHSHTFYQMEGVVVHENASLTELLALLQHFLSAYYEQDVKYKVVPAHFPFVEPGLEFSIQCVHCGGKGCKTCSYKGWIEILGAGMIHPVVLKNAGIDTKRFRGYAWGFGIDRLVMNRQGLSDIRHIYSGDLNLLKGRSL